MFRKRKEKIKKLQVDSVFNDARHQAISLNGMINYIKDYGNITKRKNNKLKYEDFEKCRENILHISLTMCTMKCVINSNKKMKKKYLDLLSGVQTKIFEVVKELEKDK